MPVDMLTDQAAGEPQWAGRPRNGCASGLPGGPEKSGVHPATGCGAGGGRNRWRRLHGAALPLMSNPSPHPALPRHVRLMPEKSDVPPVCKPLACEWQECMVKWKYVCRLVASAACGRASAIYRAFS